MSDRFLVAVDGPAGAGKGTVCREAARQFGLAYLDTGALYRAVGLHALQQDQWDPEALAQWAAQMDFTFRDLGAEVGFHAFLDGVDVHEQLRREESGVAASKVASMLPVRAALLDFQRAYGAPGAAILDGRDVGTVVLPDAQVKIFLTASLDARAKRRTLELQEKGESVSFTQIRDQMAQRDERDAKRSHAPMVVAAGATVVDTSELTLPQSVQTVARIIARQRDAAD
ncbi:(d)CMP kinase [Magnetofaba australis]|uniref:Cytidylate kinase n=1 Tax=Magnetofaba australis IT-1 TaxID=1434232 RepID=A0A1Y2K7N4_9PROT|nr:(d)CMP kinase [Magnetofaba australis]OSM06238.1 putative cytidylate kinase [Magnetofaba australis IT-1]